MIFSYVINMRKYLKSFCKGKESLFKILKKLIDCDCNRGCKIYRVLSIKTYFTYLLYVSCLLSYTNYSKSNLLSKNS